MDFTSMRPIADPMVKRRHKDELMACSKIVFAALIERQPVGANIDGDALAKEAFSLAISLVDEFSKHRLF